MAALTGHFFYCTGVTKVKTTHASVDAVCDLRGTRWTSVFKIQFFVKHNFSKKITSNTSQKPIQVKINLEIIGLYDIVIFKWTKQECRFIHSCILLNTIYFL